MIGKLTRLHNSNVSDPPSPNILHLGIGWLPLVSLILLYLVGCSGTNEKIHIQSTGEYEAQFFHDGSPIELWTDFDVEFNEPLSMQYQISFFQDGELVTRITCDPFNADQKNMHRYVENNGLVKASYLGQMPCSADLPEGETRVSVQFEAQATSFKIFRADLIIKD